MKLGNAFGLEERKELLTALPGSNTFLAIDMADVLVIPQKLQE